MSTEIVQLAQQAGPYLTAAASAYGGAVPVRAEETAADATVDLGRRILQAVFRRGGAAEQAALEKAVQEVADTPEDAELRAELAALLPAPAAGAVTITASGERSIAAHTITTAITGDGHRADA
ncbi:hypothetical protein ABT093_33255 [Kitasatospora sp. NPDC002551]|uniref:hypothetical protein n=1 Tax=Kitasatospora sp. NPDC002551 TaxID=3154539 RepID=UPI003322CE1D